MSIRILQGDVREMLNQIPDGSIQTCVTSPPYFQLRRYLDVNDPMAQFELGSEATPAEFVQNLVDVFTLIRPKMRDDSTVWINIGDSYAGSGKGPTGSNGIGDQRRRQGFIPGEGGDQNGARNRDGLGGVPGIPAKNLLLIPERFAIAMQDAGWYVRQQIVWSKASCMPESVRDRFTSAWEPIWMFTKSRSYFFDQDALRQPNTQATVARHSGPQETPNSDAYRLGLHGLAPHQGTIGINGGKANGANMRNVWHLGPAPSSLEHFASFVPEIPRRCILAGTSQAGQCPACSAPWRRQIASSHTFHQKTFKNEKNLGDGAAGSMAAGLLKSGHVPGWKHVNTLGWSPSCQCDAGPPIPQTVLDPFLGSGTSLLVASRLGRNGVGIELSPIYARMAEKRIREDAPLLDWLDAPEAGAAPSASSEPALSAEKGQAQQAEMFEEVAG